jgi:hypothetical protein
LAPWKLPVIVTAIAVPIVVGFWLGGGGVGVAVRALAVVAIVVVAAQQKPRGPIGAAPESGAPRRVLLVVTEPVEEPSAVQRIAAVARLGEAAEDEEVLVLAPARIGFLDRWASDVEGSRQDAQRNLVVTVAAFAKAGIAAEARVGDEDIVQAAEDQLQSFVADEVVLVSGRRDEEDEKAAAELSSRLRARFHHVSLDGG